MHEKMAIPALILLAFFCLLVACTISEPALEPGSETEATQTPVVDGTDLIVVTMTPTSTPIPLTVTEDTSRQEGISLTATSAMATAHPDLVPPPGEFFTPTPVPPFPGMIYQTETSLWEVGNDWQPRLVSPFTSAVLSPDETQLIYADQGDLWLTQLGDGTTRQLTTTPDHIEHNPQWWLAHPDIVLFQTMPLSQPEGEQGNGYLAALSLSEGWLTMLERDKPAFAAFAPSPDGLHIAYDRGGEPWLYHWDLQEAEPFNAAAYAGVIGVSWQRLTAPSWSSNSTKLAWIAAVQGETYPAANGNWQIAAAIFDLHQSTVTLLHPYDNASSDGWHPPAIWSPDDQWLAFITEDVDAARSGVWVVKIDDGTEHYLGPGHHPVWSPDGQWLAYQGIVPQLVETISWYALNLFIYEDGQVVDWR